MPADSVQPLQELLEFETLGLFLQPFVPPWHRAWMNAFFIFLHFSWAHH